jgi:enoyl-CoA hydratase/carnithine racemase
VTINRPQARNAIDPDVHEAMVEALARFYDRTDAGRTGEHETGL